jgi:hypothetical protein
MKRDGPSSAFPHSASEPGLGKLLHFLPLPLNPLIAQVTRQVGSKVFQSSGLNKACHRFTLSFKLKGYSFDGIRCGIYLYLIQFHRPQEPILIQLFGSRKRYIGIFTSCLSTVPYLLAPSL